MTKNNPTNIHPSQRFIDHQVEVMLVHQNGMIANSMETIAEDYDNDNIHSLVNNLPEFGDEHDHKVLLIL